MKCTAPKISRLKAELSESLVLAEGDRCNGREWRKNLSSTPAQTCGSLIAHRVEAGIAKFFLSQIADLPHFFLPVSEKAAALFLLVPTALFAIEPDVVARFAKSCFAIDQLLVRVAALFADFITEDF